MFDKENRQRQKKAAEEAKKEAAKRIVIVVNNRGKKRFVTEIHGLHHFLGDIDDLKSACSLVKKKFACSATVTGASMKGRKGERNKKKQERYQERQKERENRRKRKNGIKVEEEPKESKKPAKPAKAPQVEEFIEAQGDISDDLPKLLQKQYKIPKEKIEIQSNKK